MPANQQYIIAIDLGTSGIKVALFSTERELIESEVEDIGSGQDEVTLGIV